MVRTNYNHKTIYVNSDYLFLKGLTSLHEAASNGEIGVIKLLVEHGAKLNLKNDSG